MDPKIATRWAIAFLPGFISLFVFSQIVDSRDIKEFEFIFYLVLLTLITWGIFYVLVWAINLVITIEVNPTELHRFGTPVLIVIGFLVGATIGYLSEKNAFYVVIRQFASDLNVISSKPVSGFIFDHNDDKTLNSNVDQRDEKERDDHAWVRIMIDGGEEYHGWPAFFSKGEKFDEVFITPACKIQDSVMAKHEGAGVLLFSKFILSIEFLDRDNSECACLWGNGVWKGGKCS